MADIPDGAQVEVKGSGAKPYILKNTGGVYSCTCPAWRNQSVAIERRTCKHLRKVRGDAAEDARVGPRTRALRPVRARQRAATARPPSAAAADDGTAPPVLLAHSWENDSDLTGWWMSEKLDGVRAYWDGKQFLSRQGNPFYAPDWFTEKLPGHPLDGELFGGRKKFQRTVSIVRRQDKSDDWKEIAFVVFDAPGHGRALRGAHRVLPAVRGGRGTAVRRVARRTSRAGAWTTCARSWRGWRGSAARG